jgi:hypothetical protein
MIAVLPQVIECRIELLRTLFSDSLKSLVIISKVHNNQVMDRQGSLPPRRSSSSNKLSHRAQGAPAEEEWRLLQAALQSHYVDEELQQDCCMRFISGSPILHTKTSESEPSHVILLMAFPTSYPAEDEERMLQREPSLHFDGFQQAPARRGRRAPAKEDCYSELSRSSF